MTKIIADARVQNMATRSSEAYHPSQKKLNLNGPKTKNNVICNMCFIVVLLSEAKSCAKIFAFCVL